MLLKQPVHRCTLGTSQALGTCGGSEPTGVYLLGRKHGLENNGVNKSEIAAEFWWSWWIIPNSAEKRKSNMTFGLGFGQHHNENLANSWVQTHHSSYPTHGVGSRDAVTCFKVSGRLLIDWLKGWWDDSGNSLLVSHANLSTPLDSEKSHWEDAADSRIGSCSVLLMGRQYTQKHDAWSTKCWSKGHGQMPCVALFAGVRHHSTSYQLYRMTVPGPFIAHRFETSHLCEQPLHAPTKVLITVEWGEDEGMAQYIYIQPESICVGQWWL